MKDVETLLVKVWTVEEEESIEELQFRCLEILHRALLCSTEPCVGLAVVLQLVNPGLITKAVRSMLRNDQGISITLKTLCNWMLFWPSASRLKQWVIAMMDGLEAERQFEVLMEVTLATVDKLFQALLLPAVRPGIMEIVWRMLMSSKHTPQVFLKVSCFTI